MQVGRVLNEFLADVLPDVKRHLLRKQMSLFYIVDT